METKIQIDEKIYRELKIIKAIYYTNMSFLDFFDEFLTETIKKTHQDAIKGLTKRK